MFFYCKFLQLYSGYTYLYYISIIKVTMNKKQIQKFWCIHYYLRFAFNGNTKFLHTMFSIIVILHIHVRSILSISFISLSFMDNTWSFDGTFYICWALWKGAYFVLSLLKESILAFNHVKILFSWELAFWNSFFRFWREKNRLVSSSNIIVSKTLKNLTEIIYI